MQPATSYFDPPRAATIVDMRAGRVGGQPGGGVIGRHDVGIAGRDSASIGYEVLFPLGFDWVKSGKLPGIYAGSVTDFAPSRPPNGTNGATVRPLWRPGGTVKLYVWDMRPDPAVGGYGREFSGTGIRWPSGRWASVRLDVALNTPGAADGSATLHIDGRVACRAAGLEMRSTEAMTLAGCFWCCFFGGGTPEYAPKFDQRVVISEVAAV